MRQATIILLICGVAVGLGACAAGRGPGGEVIVGLDVATLPESATQFGMSAAKLLPSPWGDLLAAGIGGAGLLAGAHYRAKKKGEDAGWAEALDPRANVALGLPQLSPPVFVGADSGAGYAVPAASPVRPASAAGAGSTVAAADAVGVAGAGGDISCVAGSMVKG